MVPQRNIAPYRREPIAGNQNQGKRAWKGSAKSASSQNKSAQRNQQRTSKGQDSRKVHDTKGKNTQARRKSGGSSGRNFLGF